MLSNHFFGYFFLKKNKKLLISCVLGFLIVVFAFLIPNNLALHFNLIEENRNHDFILCIVRAFFPFFSLLVFSFAIYVIFTYNQHQSQHQNQRQSYFKHKYIYIFCGSILYFFSGLFWLNDSMYVHMNVPLFISVLACLLFAAYNACFWVVTIFFSRKLYMLPFVWVFLEWFRGNIFTGFSWLNYAYAFIDTPFVIFAPYFGIYGMQFMLAFFVVTCIYIYKYIYLMQDKKNHKKHNYKFLMALLVSGLFLFYIYAQYAINIKHDQIMAFSKMPQLNTRIIQGNISQDRKFNQNDLDKILDLHTSLMFKHVQSTSFLDLIITPETAFPLLIKDLPDDLYKNMQAYSKKFNTAILFGAADEPIPFIYANALFFMPNQNQKHAETDLKQEKKEQKEEQIIKYQTYYKNHLVPFGEFIPPGFAWILERLNIPMGNFMRGNEVQNNFYVYKNGQKKSFSANICYELLFGDEMAAINRINQPAFFVNATNLGWFGESALIQFLNIGRMRAIELSKPILIANNSGISAIILPNGVVQKHLLPNIIDVLDVGVPLQKIQITFYGRYGDKPILYLLLLFAICMVCVCFYKYLTKK
jgi:apolipoprotein N-acyltransferase